MEAQDKTNFFEDLNEVMENNSDCYIQLEQIKSLKIENEKLKEKYKTTREYTDNIQDFIKIQNQQNDELKEENKFLKELVALHENDDTSEVKRIKNKYERLKSKIKLLNEMFFQDNES